MRIRLLIEITMRIIILFILWEYIFMFYRIISSYNIFYYMHQLDSIVKLSLMIISSILALISLVFANVTAFVLAIVIGSIARGLIGYGPNYRILLYVSSLLLLDTIRSFYRDGQERSVYIEKRKLFNGILILVVMILAIAFTAYLPILYIDSLLKPMYIAPNTRLSLAITSSPLYSLAISIAMIIIAYRVIVSIFDIAMLYTHPSRQIALSVLLNEDDIDIRIAPPLSTLKGIIIASVIAPIIYAIVYEFILGRVIANISIDTNIVLFIRAIIAIAIFISMGIVFSRLERGLIYSSRSILLLSISMLLLIYGIGVYSSYISYGDAIYSIFHPDIGSIFPYISSTYYNFYVLFFELIEVLPKLFGAVP